MSPTLPSKLLILLSGFWLLVTEVSAEAQQSSVLANGQWVKMSFEESGVYKIDRSTLANMGFSLSNINPMNIAIYGNGGGMLPQPLTAERVQDLTENAIYITGESDGIFNSEDYILFYVDNPNGLSFNQANEGYDWQKNLYSDQVHYFITIKAENGLRMNELPNMGNDFPEINTYDQIITHEADITNILASGREWFGETITGQSPLRFTFPIQPPATNKQASITIKAMAQAFGQTTIAASLNGQTVGQLNMLSIPNSRYAVKANEQVGQFHLSTSNLSGVTQLQIQLEYNVGSVSNAIARLNSFVVSLPTSLNYSSKQLFFNNRYKEAGLSTFKISGTPGNFSVWDVTSPLFVQKQQFDQNGAELKFGAFTDVHRQYIAFEAASAPLVTEYDVVENQDLRGEQVPDLVIVSAPDFFEEAQRLANFRRSNDDLSVLVTTPQKIYNEFSSGRQDVTAIRDFMHYLKSKGSNLKYLLFMGKGSYDYKQRIENNSNFVPTYESRNSIHPLSTFSSDDYFGFLDEDEGEWIESTLGDHMLDIGIGRIPCTTREQAKIAVDKIIAYQTSVQSIGDWRRRIVFVADDGDNNLHQRDADRLATLVDTTYAAFNVRKIYLDAYEQQRTPNGETSAQATNAILDAVEQGVLIMNFTGHGAETGWMQEQVLTLQTIDEWKNTNRLPLLVTATCEFGRNDDPSIFSGAEKMIFKESGGSIALVTTARPVFSSSNYNLNLALYQTILEQPNGRFQRLGDIIKYTKNNALNGSNNRNFILLGDPSMRLSYPEKEVQITSINNHQPNAWADTLRALERVKIEGQIETGGQLVNSFNGTLNFSFLDKRSQKQTRGSEGPRFQYLERDSQLFNGRASVTNGKFQVEFVIPKNINYQFGSGKMSMYAFKENDYSDAFGAKIDFVLGGTSTEGALDTTPPEVHAFMNDTTQSGLMLVKPDADLLLKLFDENGINISESGIGQSISATLNDSVTYNLNSFFNAETDNFRKGSVLFPLRNLPLGLNEFEVRAWDNYNNLSKTRLSFNVTDENSTIIKEINAYPNPFVENTTFSVSHNSAGEALEMVVEIINARGEKVTSVYSEIESGSNTQIIEWNGTDNSGSKLGRGIYIYNVILRSKNSGKTHAKRKKLIISY